jgi:hypothetical protein
MSERAPARAIVLTVALAATAVCGLTWAIIAGDKILPLMFVDRLHMHSNVLLVTGPMLVLDVIAFVMLWRRGRSVLDLWLMVMCSIWMFEVALGGTLAGAR